MILFHIKGVVEKLNSYTDPTYIDDPTGDQIIQIIKEFDAIFTNPNKSKIYIYRKRT